MSRLGRAHPWGPAERGQATVEAALILPVIVLALLAVIQIGLVVHDRIMVTHAAREGVRVAAVQAGESDVRDAVVASGGLAPDRLDVVHQTSAGRVTVVIRYRSPTNVPLIGGLVGDVELVGSATMRREG